MAGGSKMVLALFVTMSILLSQVSAGGENDAAAVGLLMPAVRSGSRGTVAECLENEDEEFQLDSESNRRIPHFSVQESRAHGFFRAINVSGAVERLREEGRVEGRAEVQQKLDEYIARTSTLEARVEWMMWKMSTSHISPPHDLLTLRGPHSDGDGDASLSED